MVIVTEKMCVTCGVAKPADQFSRGKNKDGLCSYCKICANNYARQYARDHRDENREKLQLANKKYRKRNPDKVIAWRNINIERHHETIIAKKRKHSDEHRDEINARRRQMYKDNPQVVKAISHNRRAKVLGNGGIITPNEWLGLCAKFGNVCLCCGRADVKLTLDHVVPIKHGGKNIIANAQPLCKSCNSRKGLKHTDYRLDII